MLSETVRGEAPGCEAEVSIDVEARSVIFDFSSVTRDGAFTAADFASIRFDDTGFVKIDLLFEGEE